jgi:cytochrome c553
VKRRLFELLVLGAVVAVGGLLVMASGVVPIKASSGHWAITEWMLHFSMERSVTTHSLGITPPPLDDPDLVLRGATYYEVGCRYCHGSPEHPHPAVSQAMRPIPRYLPAVVSAWTPEKLFSIVKHGVKFTGMPAWPAADRDDEVWAMVAFLRVFPKLEVDAYRALALGAHDATGQPDPLGTIEGPAALLETLRDGCVPCHGADGIGRGNAFPILAGQSPTYLANALEAFANGERKSGMMRTIAASLDAETIRALAEHYAARPRGARATEASAESIARGKSIATLGIPAQLVPSCDDCHGPSEGPLNPAYPRHAGQRAEYLVLQLDLFAEDHRGGSPYARLMRPIAKNLTPEQRRDVAAYYASLGS